MPRGLWHRKVSSEIFAAIRIFFILLSSDLSARNDYPNVIANAPVEPDMQAI